MPNKKTRTVGTDEWLEARKAQGKDACEMPNCDGNGVPGNENVVNGVVMCDDCAVDWDNWARDRAAEHLKKSALSLYTKQ